MRCASAPAPAAVRLSAAWRSRPAIAGLAVYYLLPISLSIQVYAYLTNAFGNVLAAAALYFLKNAVRPLAHLARPTPTLGWIALGLVVVDPVRGVG